MRAWIVLSMVALAGCGDLVSQFTEPQYAISTTQFEKEWNTDNRFRVVVEEGVSIRIVATGSTTVEKTGFGDVTIELPDGTWDIEYFVDGYSKGKHNGVMVDATPPAIAGLENVGTAEAGGYTIGRYAVPERGSTITVMDAEGRSVSSALPYVVAGLRDGLHIFVVQAEDEAGNLWRQSVQVRSGAAAELPEGTGTFGIVARYTTEVRIWDLSKQDSYMTVEEAQAATRGAYMGQGYGIEPEEECVKAIVRTHVRSDMNTVERALALFQWLADETEYDEQRLVSDDLLRPCQVIGDSEGEDEDGDGLAEDGAGNGVKGGICRDLAATYVSLLRAADVPARLVSGYLGGVVDGFHAWVEFYGGAVDGQPAWIPVDVSIVDGPYSNGRMLQAFAVDQPDYLTLRVVPDNGEVEGWSTALAVDTRYDSRSVVPKTDFIKKPSLVFATKEVLCVDQETLARLVVQDKQGCVAAGFREYHPNFLTAQEVILDYGVEILRGERATVNACVAFPHVSDQGPDTVVYEHYGPAFTVDRQSGKACGEWKI